MDGHGRQRQDVAVGLAVREFEQQGVVYLKARGRAVVPGAHEDHASATVVRQVVSERADRLPYGVRRFAVEGLLPLDEVGFDVGEHRRQLRLRIGFLRSDGGSRRVGARRTGHGPASYRRWRFAKKSRCF